MPFFGLSSHEAEIRLKQNGYNELSANRVNVWKLAARQFKNPFVYLLIGAAIIAILFSEHIDAIIIVAIIFINSALGFYQEYQSANVIAHLRQLLAPRALVKRDGQTRHIPARALVEGDYIILENGNRVPADIDLTVSDQLMIDEAIVTGESFPQYKECADSEKKKAHMGTLVVGGSGEGIVIATGDRTYLGSVNKEAQEERDACNFERNITKLSKFILWLVVITLTILFFVNLFLKQDISWQMNLLFIMALAISVVPEALPLVVTIALSSSARSLSKKGVIAKRLSAVEDLGDMEILCVDKTGTLTENTLTVERIFAFNEDYFLDVMSAILCVESPDFYDMSLKLYLKSRGVGLNNWKCIRVIPFDPRVRESALEIERDGKRYIVRRGAPENILHSVDKVARGIGAYDDFEKKHDADDFLQKNSGKRILAYAIEEDGKRAFVGFAIFKDPLKDNISSVLSEAKRLGVSIKIITGDSVDVARIVAREVGILNEGEKVISGDEIEKMSDEELYTAASVSNVFARVLPNQKQRIIRALAKEKSVGFLGDGLNDVPALLEAHVGIAVENSLDVVKDAADIILTEKRIDAVLYAIQSGRKIFSNVTKYIKQTLIGNFGNFYSMAFISVLIPFLPLLPVQILLVNLLSDLPLVTVATDNVSDDELGKPRSYNLKDIAIISIILGLVTTAFDFIFFGLYARGDQDIFRTLWFIESILSEIAVIFSIRSNKFIFKSRSPSFILTVASFLVCAITIALPFIFTKALSFAFVSARDILIVIGLVIGCFIVTEVVKLAYYTQNSKLKYQNAK
ncbi:MAG: HAD-IC family P-type ATPase [Parcubacteria group bacterium]|nr:HAD-IC family P-type ATPase [Parcubacteria group bacterium]